MTQISGLGRIALTRIGAMFLGADPDLDGEEEAALRSWQAPGLALDAVRQDPTAVDRRLFTLQGALGLTDAEVVTAALVLAAETVLMVGRVLAFLQKPVGGTRPTLGLVTAAFGDEAAQLMFSGAVFRTGLLVLDREDGPAAERTLALHAHVGAALFGHRVDRPGFTVGLAASHEVVLPASIRAEAERHAKGLEEGRRSLVIRTTSKNEGRAIAAAIAQTLEREPLFTAQDEPVGLAPWLHLGALLPVFEPTVGPMQRWSVPAIEGYDGAVVVLAGPDGAVSRDGGSCVSWRVPVPPIEERDALWGAIVDDASSATELAENHRSSAGRIAELGRLARQYAALDGAAAPTQAHVESAIADGDVAGLDALAQHLPERVKKTAFVFGASLEDELALLEARCRHRESLVAKLGVAAKTRYTPGVRALFVGPSGTGKTLAAGWLATKLGVPLFRVDLSSVLSKYIGETEQNLSALLSAAEHANVVLLFDEADALFGKRTDVRHSNDRFANSLTNYLLTRIETFEGIAILTSNSRTRFDDAFTRRLDLVIDFPHPSPEQRRTLWTKHLGEKVLAPAVLNRLAVTCNLTGGQIRNVALTASVVADREDADVVSEAHITKALSLEYRKMGKPLPALVRDGEA